MITARFFLCALFLTSCTQNHQAALQPYHIDGRSKPKVALLSTKDKQIHSNPNTLFLNWSVGEEICGYLKDQILDTKQLYLCIDQCGQAVDQLLTAEDMLPHYAELKQGLYPTEFLIKCDLVAHDVTPVEQIIEVIPLAIKEQISGQARVKVRLQVFDIRSSKPKLILHELLEEKELIYPEEDCMNNPSMNQDTLEYQHSSLYEMHQKIAKRASLRLEEYIMIAKSRTVQ